MSIKSRAAAALAFIVNAVAPKVEECCGNCPQGVCHINTAQSAELVKLVDTGALVSEPRKPQRTTTATRRLAQVQQDNTRDIHQGAGLHINRQQRRALKKLGRKA